MSLKKFVGALALLTFWIALSGHAHQVYLSWTLEVGKFSVFLMGLLWVNSMSFIVMGLASEKPDYVMVGSVFAAMKWCMRTPQTKAQLRLLSRAIFTLAYTVGLLLQLGKLYHQGTYGASLFYWGSLCGTSAVWIWHSALKPDRLQIWVFTVGTSILGVIVLLVVLS